MPSPTSPQPSPPHRGGEGGTRVGGSVRWGTEAIGTLGAAYETEIERERQCTGYGNEPNHEEPRGSVAIVASLCPNSDGWPWNGREQYEHPNVELHCRGGDRDNNLKD